MIDLSIIIPHYNSATKLEKLLSSIPNRNNIEIIVIDDKSNEELVELESLWGASLYEHVLFLRNNTSRKGAGTCRNIGLSNARGKWVLFADSDDYFVEGFYNTIQRYFESNCEVIFFKPTSVIIETGEESDRHKQYEDLINNYQKRRDVGAETRLRYLYFVPWSKLISIEFIRGNDIIFDEVIASNDVMFSTKIGHNLRQFDVDSQVIYCVTKDVGTLTSTKSPRNYQSRLNVFIRYHNFIRENVKKENLQYINLKGLGIMIDSLKNKMGIKRTFLVYRQLKKNKISICDYRAINPVYLIKRFIRLIVNK